MDIIPQFWYNVVIRGIPMGKKRPRVTVTRIRGTYHLSMAGVLVDEVRSKILRRRLQILVHSYLYYDLNENLISDPTWSEWAMELVDLQEKYPHIAERVDYHEAFKDFDGSTGFDLPYRLPEITSKANYLLKICKEDKNGKRRHQTGRAEPGGTVVRLLLP